MLLSLPFSLALIRFSFLFVSCSSSPATLENQTRRWLFGREKKNALLYVVQISCTTRSEQSYATSSAAFPAFFPFFCCCKPDSEQSQKKKKWESRILPVSLRDDRCTSHDTYNKWESTHKKGKTAASSIRKQRKNSTCSVRRASKQKREDQERAKKETW